MQARQVIKRLHKQPHPYIFLLPHGIDVPRILIAKLTELFQVKKKDVGVCVCPTKYTTPEEKRNGQLVTIDYV